MEFKDYYKILAVDEKASASDIKAAYRKLARRYHPDVSKEDKAEDKFKEVSEAYEVLKDPEKRREYDELRKMGASSRDGQFRPPPGWQSSAEFTGGGFTDADAAHFSDFFEAMFGRGGDARHYTSRQKGQRNYSMRGEDIHAQLSLFLEEACQGIERQITYQVPEISELGQILHRHKTLKVKIPAGVSNGQIIRLKGQGGPGVGGAPNGDLFIEIRLAPHPVFSVDDKDLILTLPVSPWEAALGASVTVPTPTGSCEMKIPANSNSGNKLRLKGKGLPGDPPGNLIVILKIVLPENLDDKAKGLLNALAEATPFDPRKDLAKA